MSRMLPVVPRLALALILPVALSACTADEPSGDPEHREKLRAVSTPGEQWSARRGEIADVLLEDPDGGRLRPVDGVWGGPAVGYGVSWRVPIGAGAEEDLCGEAARWLVDTATKLPGEPVTGSGATPAPEALQARCRRAVGAEGETAGSGSDTFATTTNTRWADLQYGAWLTFERSGRDRFLWAAAVGDRAR